MTAGVIETDFLVHDGLAAAVLNALPDATAVLDGSGTIVGVNHVWRMFARDNDGLPDATGVGVNYLDLCARSAAAGCEDADEVVVGLQGVLAAETVHMELEYPCPSPTVNRWFLMRITPLRGPTRGAVVSHVNITRRKMAEQALAHEAAHDPLTGLANRTLFTVQLAGALSPRAGRPISPDIGVLYLDMDGFKQVNDTLGHDAGDEVLITTANRLCAQARSQDTVARLGGDEFAVTSSRISSDGLAALATRITRALAAPHLIHGHSLRVPVSVGAYLARPGESINDVLRSADQAMYAVKRGQGSITTEVP